MYFVITKIKSSEIIKVPLVTFDEGEKDRHVKFLRLCQNVPITMIFELQCMV